LFSSRGTARGFLVPKIAFVLTDGEQTQTTREIRLDREAGLLKRVGVRLIAIGVGQRVNKEELKMIASSDEDVIITKDFDSLLGEVEPLTRSACEGYEGAFVGERKNNET